MTWHYRIRARARRKPSTLGWLIHIAARLASLTLTALRGAAVAVAHELNPPPPVQVQSTQVPTLTRSPHARSARTQRMQYAQEQEDIVATRCDDCHYHSLGTFTTCPHCHSLNVHIANIITPNTTAQQFYDGS